MRSVRPAPVDQLSARIQCVIWWMIWVSRSRRIDQPSRDQLNGGPSACLLPGCGSMYRPSDP